MGSQSVFNLSAIRGFQASRAAIRQAEAETESVQDLIRAQVSGAYLAVQAAEAAVQAWTSHVVLSESLLQLALNQKSAGTGTGIEVTRARVQLANDRQQLLVAQNRERSSQLQLLKIMGLDLNRPIELTETMRYIPVPSLTPDQALQQALENRADWQAQQKRERTAELKASSIKMERVPSVSLFADYGSLGNAVNDSIPTRTFGFSVQIPLFDGGRRDARRAESASLLRQERIRKRDLLARIELEIRVALDSLQSAEEQVRAAEEGFILSENELAQAQRRYRAGVTTNLEVTQAQARVSRARENKIGALLNHNLARIDLLTAMGSLGGSRP
jgi:outer membrane protein TolC